MDSEKKFWRKLWPIATAQFLGVFNDHAFKIVSIFAAVGATHSYSKNAAFLAIVTIAYALPFLLLPAAAGYFADRYAKRNVLVLAKVAEIIVMLLGMLCFAKVADWGVAPLILIMFLMAAQSAFFSPPFNGILPELFTEKEISRANGIVGMLTTIAAILGMSGGIFLKAAVGKNLYQCGILFSIFSILGFIAVLYAIPGLPANPDSRWNWNWFKKYAEGFRLVKEKRPILLSVLGDAYFLGLGTALQLLLFVYGKYTLGVEKDIELGILQLVPAFGIGLGCYLAGRLSGKKVELGIVPFGAAGLVIFLLLSVFCPGSPMALGSIIIFPVLLLHLIFAGLSGGLFVVPLRAYVQHKTNPVKRGSIIANANVICFGAIMLAGLMMLLFTAGKEVGETTSETTSILSYLQNHFFSLQPSTIIVILAGVTLFISVYACILLPEFAMRFTAVTLTHTLYRLRIKGSENIPEYGPALLVSNHVSFIDGFLISACSSRIVRFLMHEDYYRYPLLYPFVKWLGFIEVPSPTKPKGILKAIEKTHYALRQGDVVCIFPEGKLTRNGVMDEFKKGLSRMIPEDLDVPVIPIALGMIWGSIFSYYHGKIKVRIPMEFPHPASVTVGKPIPKDTEPFEIRQIISELAAESEEIPRDSERPLHYQFAKIAKRHPFAKKLFDYNGEAVSNFPILIRSILLSREIRALFRKSLKNSPPDSSYIGIMLPNSTAAATAMLAVLMADKVPAFLNFTASSQTVAEAIKKANIDYMLTSRLFLKKNGIEECPGMIFLEDMAKDIPNSKRAFWSILTALLPRQELMNIVAPRSHRDVFRTAALLFSSGSTGFPKGVLLSHHNINSNVHSFFRIMGWRKNRDSILGNLPSFHAFGLTTNFWLPLMTGTKVVYLPNPLDADFVGKAIAQHNLTILLATPTFLQAYIRKCTSGQFKSLRMAVVGAEKLRTDMARRFKEITGLTPVEGYGCTELSPVVSINIANSILNLGTSAGKLGSVGMPMPGICAKIVDPKTGASLPHDTEGLMLVKGPNVMQGYLNDPGKTAEVIKDGWYNTGDVAKMDAGGCITITGRLSRFSKIAGEMVPHEMIENAIHDLLQTEESCIAVCGATDKAKGEKLIVLYTSPELSPEKIVEGLRKRGLPNLWIPKAENFQKIDIIPLLGSGKLDMAALKEITQSREDATS